MASPAGDPKEAKKPALGGRSSRRNSLRTISFFCFCFFGAGGVSMNGSTNFAACGFFLSWTKAS
jgi:hypothetical protein